MKNKSLPFANKSGYFRAVKNARSNFCAQFSQKSLRGSDSETENGKGGAAPFSIAPSDNFPGVLRLSKVQSRMFLSPQKEKSRP